MTLQTLITYLIQEETMLKSLDDNFFNNPNNASTSTLLFKQNSKRNNFQRFSFNQNPTRFGYQTYQGPKPFNNNSPYLGNKPSYGQNKKNSNKFTNQSRNSTNFNRFNNYNNSNTRHCSYCRKPNHSYKDCRKRFFGENKNPTKSQDQNK